ncbi:MAG TPA: helix-turn-helix transcriptional regulator [Myxococcota bacterium]|nr:helix-turn-helix transcriptional regulator [Myxococcota bacterium]
MSARENGESTDEDRALVSHRKIDDRPYPLSGLAWVLILSGELELRGHEFGPIRLLPADVFLLSPDASVKVKTRTGVVELLEFHAGAAWLNDVFSRAGCAWPAGGEPVSVGRAGSETARRTGRSLRKLAFPAATSEASARLHEAAGHFELVACAFDARHAAAPWMAPRRVSSRRRTGFLARVTELAASGTLEDLSLERFSAEIGLSPRHTSRLFREELGAPFREWVAATRLATACRLLRDTELPVIEVAAESGWRSLPHFNTAFRRHKGQTPTAFRRAARQSDPQSEA